MIKREFYFGILIFVTLMSGISTSCLRSILCPCGTKGKLQYYTQCVNYTFDEEIACERWANCKTCDHNTTYCLTCPPGGYGFNCVPDTVMCKNLGFFQNGRVGVFFNNPNSRRLPTPQTYNAFAYPVGTRIRYTCNDGYRLEGERNSHCTSNGKWTREMPRCVADCGRSGSPNEEPGPDGRRTDEGLFPWIVLLGLNNSIPKCGGLLLDQRTVLTVANCFSDPRLTVILYFGRNKGLDDDEDKNVESRMISKITIHPEYDGKKFTNDIAIVKFYPKVTYSKRIQPMCLPSLKTSTGNIAPGNTLYTMGFWQNEEGLMSPRLIVAPVPIQTEDACVEAFQKKRLLLNMTLGTFCGGFKDQNNIICPGASGFPIVFYDREEDRFTLEGLISYGMSGTCQRKDTYEIFTKVSHYLEWIFKNF